MIVALAASLALLCVASVIPHAWRTHARVALWLLLLATPMILLGVAISRWDGATFASYLGLIPVVITWCCMLDAKGGLSNRLARMGPARRVSGAPRNAS